MIRHRVFGAIAELAGRAGAHLNTLRWLAERLELFAVSRARRYQRAIDV